MDCETCKEKRKVVVQTPKDVPYIVHEGAVARLERVIKRMKCNLCNGTGRQKAPSKKKKK